MNKNVTLFLKRILILLCLVPLFVSNAHAHSGRTDSSGGHYNSSTGEYHYHHGYPAHSHVNGCTYDYDDQTNHSSSSSSGGGSYSSNSGSIDSSNYADNYSSNSSKDTSISKQDDNSDEQNDSSTKQYNENGLYKIVEILFVAFIAIIVVYNIVRSIIENVRPPKASNDNGLPHNYNIERTYFSLKNNKNVVPKLNKNSPISFNRVKMLAQSWDETYQHVSTLKSEISSFDISPELKHDVESKIQNKLYKTAVYTLINHGIYRDYFYEMIDLKIFPIDLKKYADYRAFMSND